MKIRCPLLLVCALMVSLAGRASAERPNIILIIADDQAWDDSNVYGHPNLHLPAQTRLAQEGMRFDRGFVTSSSCSPSRSSIITGRYPHNTGAEQLHWSIPDGTLTFVELLRDSGYWTAAAGKWHLGEAVKKHFDVVKEADVSGFQLPTGDAEKLGKFIQRMEGDARSGCDQWVPTLKSRPKDKPFFLWLGALDPHRPYDENIREKPYKPEYIVIPPYVIDHPSVRKDLALYYDEIARLDDYIGRVLDELDRQGIADNTLILYISDNGRPFVRDKTTLRQWHPHAVADALAQGHQTREQHHECRECGRYRADLRGTGRFQPVADLGRQELCEIVQESESDGTQIRLCRKALA